MKNNSQGIFDIIEMAIPGQQFPRQIGQLATADEVMHKCGLHQTTMRHVLNRLATEDSVVIEDKYIVSLSPKFMRDLRLDEIVQSYGYEMTLDEIAKELEITLGTVCQLFGRAKKKMIADGKLRSFLHAVSELRGIRNMRYNESGMETITETTITMSIE